MSSYFSETLATFQKSYLDAMDKISLHEKQADNVIQAQLWNMNEFLILVCLFELVIYVPVNSNGHIGTFASILWDFRI